ncbi:MAG: DUF2865 domain-containing protein [Xanthobacteraceae bacterium]
MIFRLTRRLGPAAFLLALSTGVATAQLGGTPAGSAPPPGPGGAAGRNPLCARLVAQLTAFDQGGQDPARADQIKRYEDSVSRQQAELDRTVAQARRSGCEGSGFFSLFNGQGAQCGDINSRISQMRGNLDKMISDLQQLQAGGDRTGQRRALIQTLAQYDCGAQYRSAVATQPRGFLEQLFGPGEGPGPDVAPTDMPSGSTFRTLCVRTCDGYYYPISFSTLPSHFQEDERACQRTCPATEAILFMHHNPGEDVSQAVSLAGRRYSDLPNAFRYRKEFVATCSCRAAGQSWADALKKADDRDSLDRSDIVVTEERAKQLSQPLGQPQGRRPAKPPAGTPATTTAAPPPAAATASAPPDAPSGGPIRSVGPTFIPPR